MIVNIIIIKCWVLTRCGVRISMESVCDQQDEDNRRQRHFGRRQHRCQGSLPSPQWLLFLGCIALRHIRHCDFWRRHGLAIFVRRRDVGSVTEQSNMCTHNTHWVQNHVQWCYQFFKQACQCSHARRIMHLVKRNNWLAWVKAVGAFSIAIANWCLFSSSLCNRSWLNFL